MVFSAVLTSDEGNILVVFVKLVSEIVPVQRSEKVRSRLALFTSGKNEGLDGFTKYSGECKLANMRYAD